MENPQDAKLFPKIRKAEMDIVIKRVLTKSNNIDNAFDFHFTLI
jgi:hypothetical protein